MNRGETARRIEGCRALASLYLCIYDCYKCYSGCYENQSGGRTGSGANCMKLCITQWRLAGSGGMTRMASVSSSGLGWATY